MNSLPKGYNTDPVYGSNVHERITLVPTGDEDNFDVDAFVAMSSPELPSSPSVPPTSQLSIETAKDRIRIALLRVKDAINYNDHVWHADVRQELDYISVDLQVALEYLR